MKLNELRGRRSSNAESVRIKKNARSNTRRLSESQKLLRHLQHQHHLWTRKRLRKRLSPYCSERAVSWLLRTPRKWNESAQSLRTANLMSLLQKAQQRIATRHQLSRNTDTQQGLLTAVLHRTKALQSLFLHRLRHLAAVALIVSHSLDVRSPLGMTAPALVSVAALIPLGMKSAGAKWIRMPKQPTKHKCKRGAMQTQKLTKRVPAVIATIQSPAVAALLERLRKTAPGIRKEASITITTMTGLTATVMNGPVVGIESVLATRIDRMSGQDERRRLSTLIGMFLVVLHL